MPGGTGKPRVLGIAEISNDVQLSLDTKGKMGAYNVTLSKWAPKEEETWKKGRVEAFDRKKRGPWDLLFLALRDCVGKRNPEVTGYHDVDEFYKE